MGETANKGEGGLHYPPKKAFTDLLVVCIVAFCAFIILYSFDVGVAVDRWGHERGLHGLNNIFLATIILLAAFGVFSYRRYRKAWREAEEKLNLYHEGLEHTVDKRTASFREVNTELEREIAGRRKVEESLRLFSGAVEEAADGIQIVSLNGHIIYSNRAVEEIYGFSPEELMGKHVNELNVDVGFASRVILPALRERGRWVGELLVKHRNGHQFLLWLTTSLVRDEEGKPIATVGIIRDITELKRSEEALRDSEAQFRLLAEQSPNMIFINSDGKVVYANQQCEKSMGYGVDEILSPDFHFMCLIAPESEDLVRANFKRHMRGEDIPPYEYTLLTKDGNRLSAIHTTKLIQYGGEPAILGIITDITDRKRFEAALRDSERRYRGLVDNAPVGVFQTNSEGDIIYANSAISDMLGFGSVEELKATKVPDSYRNPEDRNRFLRALEQDGRVSDFEVELVTKSGETRNVIINAEFASENISGMMMDITERKKAEQSVAHSEKFLGTIFHSIRDPFSIVDRDYRIVRLNDAYAEMRHIPVERLLGQKCFEILQKRDDVCDDCTLKKTFDSGDRQAKEKYLTFAGGHGVWVEIFTYPLFDDDGNVTHVIEYTRDISDRKATEKQMGQLISELEVMSRLDGLTELLNRRALITELEAEIVRARRYGHELAIVLCDIDFFKETNDKYGHEAGDKALILLADTLKESVRASDIVGRYGGDEFMVVLPETSIKSAVELSTRTLKEVGSAEVKLADDRDFGMTISIGITGLGGEDDADSLIRRADMALYNSKREGRSKISVQE